MNLVKLYQTRQTVFTRSSLAQIYPELNDRQMTNALYYAVKNGQLQKIRRGFFVKPEYDKYELACKLYPPSYVSMDSVLFEAGITFQLNSEITCISTVSKEVVVDNQRLKYRKMKDEILTNLSGIVNDGMSSVANVERAVLDTWFMDGERHLDNLRPINWNRVYELLPIYHNNALNERVKKMEGYAKDDK